MLQIKFEPGNIDDMAGSATAWNQDAGANKNSSHTGVM